MAYKFRLNQKKKPTGDALPLPTQEISETVLEFEGATRTISSIVFIPKYNIVAAASHDNYVRTYSIEEIEETYPVFSAHTDQVRDMALLFDDVIVSVGDDRCVRTWHATTSEVIDSFFFESWALSVERLEENKFIVGNAEGELVIFSYNEGKELKKVRTIFKADTDWVFDLKAHGQTIVSGSHNKSISVWNQKTRKRMDTLDHDDWVKCLAVRDKTIAAGCHNGKIYLYRISGKNVTRLTSFSLNRKIQTLSFVNDGLIAVGSSSGTFCLIDTKGHETLFDITLNSKKPLWCTLLLPDGRIVCGEKDGRCTLVLPPENHRSTLESRYTDFIPERSFSPRIGPHENGKNYGSSFQSSPTRELENHVSCATNSDTSEQNASENSTSIDIKTRTSERKPGKKNPQQLMKRSSYTCNKSEKSEQKPQRIEIRRVSTNTPEKVVQNVEHSDESYQNNQQIELQQSLRSIHLELKYWFKKRHSTAFLKSLSACDIASVLAAYLVNYQDARSSLYINLKKEFQETFEYNLLDGSAIIGILQGKSIERKKKLLGCIISSIKSNNEIGHRLGLEFRLDRIFGKILSSSSSDPRRSSINNRRSRIRHY